jgi:hypothetical protein
MRNKKMDGDGGGGDFFSDCAARRVLLGTSSISRACFDTQSLSRTDSPRPFTSLAASLTASHNHGGRGAGTRPVALVVRRRCAAPPPVSVRFSCCCCVCVLRPRRKRQCNLFLPVSWARRALRAPACVGVQKDDGISGAVREAQRSQSALAHSSVHLTLTLILSHHHTAPPPRSPPSSPAASHRLHPLPHPPSPFPARSCGAWSPSRPSRSSARR